MIVYQPETDERYASLTEDEDYMVIDRGDERYIPHLTVWYMGALGPGEESLPNWFVMA